MNEFASAITSRRREPQTASTVKCGRWISGNKVCGEPCVLVLIVDRHAPFAFGLCREHQGLNLKDLPIDKVLAVPTQISAIEEKLNQIGERQEEIAAIFSDDDLTEEQIRHARRVRDTLIEVLGDDVEESIPIDLQDDPDLQTIYEKQLDPAGPPVDTHYLCIDCGNMHEIGKPCPELAKGETK